MLQHKFEIENKDGTKETRTSTLCEYGAPTGTGGYSAMAKLVGVTCGVGKSPRCQKFLPALQLFPRGEGASPSEGSPLAALGLKQCLTPHSPLKRGIANVLRHTAVKQVLNGTISDKGILAPMNSKINDPLMKELKEKYG
jgi:hypothetical protein